MVQVFDRGKFSKAIKTKRVIDLDLTLRDAAKKAKVSFSTLSRMENEAEPELGNFIKVCNWLDLPASEFIVPKKSK
jgi:transcriptional regulator with XRE-family HTH domain